MAILGSVITGFPSKKMLVIGVTGTKGKSSTTEMINAILEEAGYSTVLINSIRFKVGAESVPNTLRMSMPGRFFIQDMLLRGVNSGCTAAVLEMTSEGARQYRHRGIDLDACVFLNLAPEHIESHGSLENYMDAKLELGRQLGRSSKSHRVLVGNADDPFTTRFFELAADEKILFSLDAVQPYTATEHGGTFTLDSHTVAIPMPGEFSIKNALAAAVVCKAFGISIDSVVRALARVRTIAGRAERIEQGQKYTVVVDYAHTPDSLEALYKAYKYTPSAPSLTEQPPRKLICVLGSTGGGRDLWKRPVMGTMADMYCDDIILTNEDPYDEDPRAIVDMIAHGIKRSPLIIMDRRTAIHEALSRAHPGDAVLITGKGTDPTICGPRGTKEPWSDAQVVREELTKILL